VHVITLGELDLLENQPEQALAVFRQTGDEGFILIGQAKAQFSLGRVDVSRRILEQMIAIKGVPLSDRRGICLVR